jgi:DNA-binding response OmpR family regulator
MYRRALKTHRVMVVDDTDLISKLLRADEASDRFACTVVESMELALRKAHVLSPDLVLLNSNLCKHNEGHVCRVLQSDPHTAHVPIVVLANCGEEKGAIHWLECGVAAYIEMPISDSILTARLRALLRGADEEAAEGPTVVELHGMRIHPGKRQLMVKGKQINLSLVEFRLLHFLASSPGCTFSRDDLVPLLGGVSSQGRLKRVDWHVSSLRSKLGPLGEHIRTVFRVGYFMAAEPAMLRNQQPALH